MSEQEMLWEMLRTGSSVEQRFGAYGFMPGRCERATSIAIDVVNGNGNRGSVTVYAGESEEQEAFLRRATRLARQVWEAP